MTSWYIYIYKDYVIGEKVNRVNEVKVNGNSIWRNTKYAIPIYFQSFYRPEKMWYLYIIFSLVHFFIIF